LKDPSPHEHVLERLEAVHGRGTKPRRDPVDELVLTILSQNTTDENRDRAWKALRKAFPDWESVRRAEPEALRAAIRPAGLGRQKAAAILAALDRLQRDRGRPSLDHLDAMDDREALEYLTGVRGVGTKTAACVLCFALRRPVLPVDTHVRRVSERLGWIEPGASARRAHEVLNRTVPETLRFRLHLALIAHGRATCSARRPECGSCVLASGCPRVGVDAD
jgi:endonuclease-3